MIIIICDYNKVSCKISSLIRLVYTVHVLLICRFIYCTSMGSQSSFWMQTDENSQHEYFIKSLKTWLLWPILINSCSKFSMMRDWSHAWSLCLWNNSNVFPCINEHKSKTLIADGAMQLHRLSHHQHRSLKVACRILWHKINLNQENSNISYCPCYWSHLNICKNKKQKTKTEGPGTMQLFLFCLGSYVNLHASCFHPQKHYMVMGVTVTGCNLCNDSPLNACFVYLCHFRIAVRVMRKIKTTCIIYSQSKLVINFLWPAS